MTQRPFSVDITPLPSTGADVDFFATKQTTTGGIETFTGSTAVPPRHVTLTSTDDISSKTLTIEGKNRYGATFSEEITGPNNNTVTGAENFLTVSAFSGTTTATSISIGTATTFETGWVACSKFSRPTSVGVILSGTATGTYDIQYTLDRTATIAESDVNALWSTTTDSTATQTVHVFDAPITAFRVRVSDWLGGGIKVRGVFGD